MSQPINLLPCPFCGGPAVLDSVGGPTPEGRSKFLEKQGWKMVNGEWVCNFCTGIGIVGCDGGQTESSEDQP